MTAARRALWCTLAVASVLVAACGSSGGSKAGSTSTSTKVTTTTSTTAPVAGTTAWRDDTAHWRQLAPGAFATGRKEVADELAARYRGGDTSDVGLVAVAEVGTEEPLVVELSEKVDADTVLSRQIQVTLEGGDAGWAVQSARTRDFCYRMQAPDATTCS